MSLALLQRSLYVDWTRYTKTKMPVAYCPTCKRRRRFLAQFQDYYGWQSTCLSCGDQWQDSERLERPFYPRWRQKNIAKAKQQWKEYRATVTKGEDMKRKIQGTKEASHEG